MPEYSLAAMGSVVAVVGLEVFGIRTGIFRRPAYWLTMLIVLGFQVPVDGWLTKTSAPIVLYRPAATSGVRLAWGIPIEDFLFGFALVTLVLALWQRQAPSQSSR